MTTPIFETFLTAPAMAPVFGDHTVVQAMFDFEAALSRAQAAEGLIPAGAADIIASVCKAELYDLGDLVGASSRAGSLAIPLVKALTARVALVDAAAAGSVHLGSTSQDVIDTAMVLATRRALALLDTELEALAGHLLALAEQHAETPVLARTLLQPAVVTSFGLKCVNWLAPIVRSREQLRQIATRALALQLGGAVGTLSVMGEAGAAVARRMAADLKLALPPAPWHTQRDEWLRLGCEVAICTGSLSKIATDLSLMAQGEVAELAEPSGAGRGGSSAMPHKRNPVSAMLALACAQRSPARVATLLGAMAQEHERGLGNWQAELAEWPGLFAAAHGAARALAEAFGGLQVDAGRMRRNIDSLHGLVFAEAASALLAGAIGKQRSQLLLEQLSRRCVAENRPLEQLVLEAVQADPALAESITPAAVAEAFDPVSGARPATRQVRERVAVLRSTLDEIPERAYGWPSNSCADLSRGSGRTE